MQEPRRLQHQVALSRHVELLVCTCGDVLSKAWVRGWCRFVFILVGRGKRTEPTRRRRLVARLTSVCHSAVPLCDKFFVVSCAHTQEDSCVSNYLYRRLGDGNLFLASVTWSIASSGVQPDIFW